MFQPRCTPQASIQAIPDGFRLSLPAGSAGEYRLAQIDDYAQLPRRRFPARPPRTLSLRARASADSLPGTWGFGLWNDPFGFSLGFGGQAWRLPALPNAAWFFHASAENYLSFGEDQPAQGFLAQVFRSPRFDLRLLLAGLLFPLARRRARRLLSEVIREQAAAVSVEVTEWHLYRLGWEARRVFFEVDGALVLESPVAPNPPLGVVIWIDNQFAAFRPTGQLAWGTLANPAAWLEVRDIRLE
jgi:hypothetical protein